MSKSLFLIKQGAVIFSESSCSRSLENERKRAALLQVGALSQCQWTVQDCNHFQEGLIPYP